MTSQSILATPLLEVKNLRVAFTTRRGTLVAIDDVSFSIAPGEVLGVVGESGAGKSLTGAAIIGLLEPPGRIVGGEILLDGRRIDNLDASQMRRIRGRQIGAIFQDPLTSLDPLQTVGRQLVETIRTHLDLTPTQARGRAIELLDSTGIPAAAARFDHYPHQFSGGMRQRVVIALALAAEPRLIVADEPTTALDVSIQAQIIALLKRLCREHGTAIMLVTHDMGVIAETVDRVAVMYAGRIAEIGPVADVIHRPHHPYTVGLMGSIPLIGHARERLAQIDGAMPRLNAIPPGCAFNPRCPMVVDACRTVRPELVAAGRSMAACLRHGVLPRGGRLNRRLHRRQLLRGEHRARGGGRGCRGGGAAALPAGPAPRRLCRRVPRARHLRGKRLARLGAKQLQRRHALRAAHALEVERLQRGQAPQHVVPVVLPPRDGVAQQHQRAQGAA
jgi:peptide/nickel transport system ATP-binding protein